MIIVKYSSSASIYMYKSISLSLELGVFISDIKNLIQIRSEKISYRISDPKTKKIEIFKGKVHKISFVDKLKIQQQLNQISSIN